MRGHLKKLHAAHVEHHDALARAYAKKASRHMEADESDEAEHAEAVSRAHFDLAEVHRQLHDALGPSDYEPTVGEERRRGHGGDLDGPRKALGDLEPTNVKAVLPAIPDGLRLIPRPGGPQIDTSGLDSEIAEIVGG